MSEDMNMRMLLVAFAVSVTQGACKTSSRPNAADDPQRSVGGISDFGPVTDISQKEPTRVLETGPFFLTDVMIDGYWGKIFTARDAACKEEDPHNLFEWQTPVDALPQLQSHHGMRLWVPAGRTLCFEATKRTKVVWAGFRP